jgi:hypothetical protein
MLKELLGEMLQVKCTHPKLQRRVWSAWVDFYCGDCGLEKSVTSLYRQVNGKHKYVHDDVANPEPTYELTDDAKQLFQILKEYLDLDERYSPKDHTHTIS